MAAPTASAHQVRAGQVRAWLAGHSADYVERLRALVRVRSVSSDPARRADVRAAAELVAAELADAGLPDCEVAETDGHPVVLAARRDAGPDRPTLLVYLHYDVQPEGELAEWSVPPFDAVLADGRLIGRGSADDKGPILMLCAALRGLAECGGTLPVNLIVLVDGEEEDGSASLPAFLDRRGAELAADLAVISDTSMLGVDRPSLVLATRGTAGLEVELRTLDHDVHSGKYGGAAANAAVVLAEVVAALHDEDGRVAVPGFYHRVRPVDEATLAALAASDPPEQDWLRDVGARSESGERALRLHQRVWTRPTLDLVGTWSGHTGPGMKTAIPAVATAKISCRLVADQDPDEIAALLAAHLRQLAAGRADVTVRPSHGSRPVVCEADSPAASAAIAAYEWGYGTRPVLIREGGSIPIASTLAERIGPVLFLGFGLHGQQEHAPDEWLSVRNFELAANALAMFLLSAADLPRTRAAGA
jgi:acetylornithine deacetylase/succinyl-diaminopimelate desuccinylase-like protein